MVEDRNGTKAQCEDCANWTPMNGDGPTDPDAYRALAATTARRLHVLSLEIDRQGVLLAEIQVTTQATRKAVGLIGTAMLRHVAVPITLNFFAAFLGTCLAMFAMHYR